MSSYNARVPADQQCQLIMECRNSRLSDYQWCMEHGIHPGTFYNWVSQLRKKACCKIPVSIFGDTPSPAPVQEVVRLNLHSESMIREPAVLTPPVLHDPIRASEISVMIEISLGNTTIRIANGTEPAMLDRILSLVKGVVCQAISR